MVKHAYEYVEGRELKRFVPSLSVWFEDIVTGGDEDEERKKNLTTCFYGTRSTLEVKFVVEKKRVNRSLAELAAEEVVKSIYSEEEIDSLEIPRELYDTVRAKYRGAEWVRDYWRKKTLICINLVRQNKIGIINMFWNSLRNVKPFHQNCQNRFWPKLGSFAPKFWSVPSGFCQVLLLVRMSLPLGGRSINN